MTREPDHYDALGVDPKATAGEIKRRYRQLMREAHPDANAGDPLANRRAARINAAYETLGNAEKRRAYDAGRAPIVNGHRKRSDRVYAHWAEQEDWEDIVASAVPPPNRRPAHVHTALPLIEPEEIEVSMAELRLAPRVKRGIRVTNRCSCTIRGDVSTSEPWVWGPIGRFLIKPGETIEFDVEVISRKVSFPGISRVLFVANDWTGVVPVKITGYNPKARRVPPATEMPYVRHRRPRVTRNR
ncbi:MAG TPA: J domain-containing protein [Dehalococcoidia bacterium]